MQQSPVFNAAQVDGTTLPADRAPGLPETARIAAAERFFAALPGLDLRHGGASAFYASATDHVRMPPFADFRAAEGYYGVLGHDATHWTGHPGRLARDLAGRFGSTAYAAEELVAELGAAFAAAVLGLRTEPRPDHARYVARWLDLLRADRRAVFAAAGKAQAATDWLLTASVAGAASVTSSAGPQPFAPAAASFGCVGQHQLDILDI
jgi:antirestriction protein ArdC